MTKIAQTFWLENLESANTFNEWVYSEISDYVHNRVLEVGCGTGNFTAFLARQCSELIGVDSCHEYVSLSKKRFIYNRNISIIHMDIMEYSSVCKQSFDSIVMLDVLEHIENDIETLRNLSRLLVRGGVVVIKVPALNFLYGSLDRAIGHYRRYDRQSLGRALRVAGFDLVRLWYFNFLGILGWWMNGRLLKSNVPSPNEISIFNRLVPFARHLERFLSMPIGLSLFAIGRKE